MTWSESEQIALAIVPKVSSLLSLFGSIWIVVEVMTEDGSSQDNSLPKRHHSYHRLLLAMSIYDILESGWNFASTWPIPGSTENVWQAYGTTQTCSAQGFFLTLSVAVPIYNALLALYYMLVINYNVSNRYLQRCVEPSMHITAGVWAFGTAIYSVATGLINNANLWCWIAPLPAGCKQSWKYGDEGDCIRGDNAYIYRWAFYFGPLWFCIFFATVCTLKVFLKVRDLDKRTAQYRRPQSRFSIVSSEGAKRSQAQSASDGPGTNEVSSECFQREESPPGEVVRDEGSKPMSDVELEDLGEEPNPGLGRRVRSSLIIRKSQRGDFHPRTRQVFRQSLWYLGVFYVTHLWSTINRIVQQTRGGQTYFGLILLHSFFDPLQGFLNFLVYQRPRYMKYRRENADWGVSHCLHRSLRWTILSADSSRNESKRKGVQSG